MACEVCRVKKVKCDSSKPTCQYCREHRLECTYRHRAKRKSRSNDRNEADVDARLLRMESLILELREREQRTGNNFEHRDRPRPSYPPTGSPRPVMERNNDPVSSERAGLTSEIVLPVERERGSPVPIIGTGGALPGNHTQLPLSPGRTDMVDEILWDSNIVRTFQDDNSGLMSGEHGQEYAGSSCGMSLLTDPGLEWLSQRTDDHLSLDKLKEMVTNILSQLRLPTRGAQEETGHQIGRVHSNLPPIEVAGRYIDVYFTKQWLWPIIRESSFREACNRYWNDPASCDRTWYGLYNVVLALGCRACISSGTPKSFRDSEHEAWAYFDNTVSVQSGLMYQKTSLEAVQTFALMTVFAQGVGGPQPEYIYCAIAVRLATGLGLHKSSSKAWNLSDLEMEDRNRLFWSLYCLDKTIAFRTGRPSLLDDSDISCPFPRHLFHHLHPHHYRPDSGSHGSKEPLDFFLCVARYARICSRVIKSLYSATSLMQAPEARTKTVMELYDELKQWRRAATPDAGEDALEGWRRLRETKMTSTPLFYQRLVLEYFYYDCVVSLEKASRLEDTLYKGRVARSILASSRRYAIDQLTADSVEAARSMCLLTQQIDIESYAPNWLVIYYPLTAIITLFSHIATNPLSVSATTDIALIQCVQGLFGRIEYISSGSILLTKSGEFAKIASTIVERAKNHDACPNSSSSNNNNNNISNKNNNSSSSSSNNNNSNNSDNIPSQQTESVQVQQRQQQQLPQSQHQEDGGDMHNAFGADVHFLENSTIDPPFFHTQAGNHHTLPDPSESVPYIADQFQTLNWLDWNFFVQDDAVTTR